jgi:hypothetical protein
VKFDVSMDKIRDDRFNRRISCLWICQRCLKNQERLTVCSQIHGCSRGCTDTCFIGTTLFPTKKSLQKLDSYCPPKTPEPEAHRQSAIITSCSAKNNPLNWWALLPFDRLILICSLMQINVRQHYVGRFLFPPIAATKWDSHIHERSKLPWHEAEST